jgi:hypothetical protein
MDPHAIPTDRWIPNAQCLADGATTSEKALLNGPMINYLQGQLRSAEVPDGAPPRVGSFSSLGG